jgi:4-hydroxythreonine-4-phosphate dehydrogenase
VTRPIALTCGEPAGIGIEIAAKAAAVLRGDPPFFLIADRRHVAERAPSARLIEIADPADAADAARLGLALLHRPFPGRAEPGRPDPAQARAVIDTIARAVDLVQTGRAAALTTGPIHKQALIAGAGFGFPGHTEFLAHLAGGGARPVMMLAAPALRVVPVTIHAPLAAVPGLLTPTRLEDTLRITDAALRNEFGLTAPRIAVAGLNPHAGEGGAMGREESAIIAPVLDRLRAEGLTLAGPLSADTMFHDAARATYDCAVAMYHDQALIPLKTLDFAGGVNITLGLPFIRTSPDHGTAFDLAGTGRADPASLIAALRMAHDMAAARSG